MGALAGLAVGLVGLVVRIPAWHTVNAHTTRSACPVVIVFLWVLKSVRVYYAIFFCSLWRG